MNQTYDPRLLDLVKYTNLYFEVDKDLSFQDNILNLVDEIKSNPVGLMLSLTVKTYYYLKDCFESKQAKDFKKVDFYEDDFDLLVKLNIINIKTNMINPIFNDAIGMVLENKITKDFAYAVSLLKGIIDTYGIVSIDFAQKILSKFIVDNQKFSAINIFRASNLLNAYASIKDNNFVHVSLEDDETYNAMIQYRNQLEISFDYKVFKGTDYCKFAANYNYEIFRPFLNDAQFISLFNSHAFNMGIHTTKLLLKNKIIDDETACKLELLNLTYPKWGLKGYTSDEYYKLVKDLKK